MALVGEKISNADKADVVADYQAGMNVKAICKKHGCCPATVLSWVDAAGVPRRKTRKPKSNVIPDSLGLSDDDGRWVPKGPIQVWLPW